MSSIEIGVVLGWMFAGANGLGARSPWSAAVILETASMAAVLLGGCVLLARWAASSGPSPVRCRRVRDAETAAVVRICFASWIRIGRWAEDLGRALAAAWTA